MDVSKERRWNDQIKEWRGKVEAIGCTLTRSPHAYEIAKVEGPGVRAIIYPHKLPASRTHSARLRDSNSADKVAFDRVAHALKLWINNRGSWTPDPDKK